MKNLKVGLGICILLAVLDVVGVFGSGAEDAPPLALNILSAVVGVVTLVAVKRAFQADPTALKVVLGSRLASVVLSVPVYFVDDAPTWAKAAVGAYLALTAVGIALILRSREAVHSAA